MYELVYSKHKSLKDDDRLTYYSMHQVLSYHEVHVLALFSILYITSISINLGLAHPEASDLDWPFTYYVYGASTGLTIVAICSDFIFQQRMCFGPPFLFASISLVFHLALFIMDFFSQIEDLQTETKQWIMFCEGLIDDNVQVYMYFMAPI